ncbi:phage tail spike protein [Paenibacillus lentus]|uniref:phage tail spike protein n=1 Tax=Paenibacillus lentus TaxID=1338368 RepID=UPI003649E22F
MLGEIDYNLKPIQPQYFLCKPNREIIGKLKHIYNDSIQEPLNQVGELEFTIPLQIDIHHKLIKNKYAELIRERYLIKVVRGRKIDWFIVVSLSQASENDQESMTVKCYSTYHMLTDKMIKSYSVEAYYCRQVLTDMLANTVWDIDYIDADFDLAYRAFEFQSSTVLDAIYSIADKYNAIVEFNTDAKTVSFKKPELFGLNRGLTFSFGKYLKSMNKQTTADQMVTRLTAKGKDDLTIHHVNPTGQGYIENFSYFVYPFRRNDQQTVLSSSFHMSDSLCHALLDYEELVKSKTGLIEGYIKQRQVYEDELTQLDIDHNRLKNNEKVITGTMLSQQFDGKMFFEKYVHSGSSSHTFEVNSTYAYAILIKADNTSGLSVYLNGQLRSLPSGQWAMLGKVKDIASIQVALQGGNTGVFIQVANISLDEWNGSGNEQDIVERYSLDHKENQLRLKEIEINNKLAQITDIQNQIDALQVVLAADNNFTPAQLQELNEFVIEREFSDDVYVDEHDLYEAAQGKLRELQQPQLSIDIDIVNFLEIVGEQRNWHKLVLGDFVNIKYEPTDTYVTARIVSISYDYEGQEISLTLSNIKDVSDDSKDMEKFIQNSTNTNIIVDASKHKWGKAIVDVSEMSQLFENFWNKVTNDINMASNEHVVIDRKGITIIDPNDPLRFLRATHGVLGLTRSGGLKYETAISPDGVIAEMVLGKIILGQRVVIGDTTGVFTIEGSRLMIDDRCGREVLKLGLLSESPDKFGIFVNRYASPTDCNNTTILNRVNITADEGLVLERNRNGSFQKTLYTSTDGDLYMIGNLRVGEDERVFIADRNGISVGASIWEYAPFRVDMRGNCWLDSLFANNAEIKNSLFKDGHIEGSSLVLRDALGGVIKMYPDHGLWFGAEQFNDAIASIAMDGTAKFKKLIVTDRHNKLLIDSEQKKIFMNNWDIVGAGAIDTDLLSANIVTAMDGFVTDLTASRMTTLTGEIRERAMDYIRIDGHTQKFIRGNIKPGSAVHKSLPDGRLLYWIDASQSGQMTTEVTNWPVMTYDMEEKDKMVIGLNDTRPNATPFIRMGIGDGNDTSGGKSLIDKYDGGLKTSYHSSGSAIERSIDLADNGITIQSDGQGHITIKAHSIKIEAAGTISFSGTEYVFTG